MKFIHTFWSKPFYENKFLKFEENLTYTIIDYTYSALCIHQLGKEIVLFADQKGADILSHIPYDKVYIVDNLEDESIHFAAQLKFYALEHSNLGDVLIDGDLFLRNSNSLSIIENNEYDLIYSFYEPYKYTLNSSTEYYDKLLSKMHIINENGLFKLPKTYEDMEWVNTSLLRINNQELLNQYVVQYKKHKNLLFNIDFEDTWPDIILEQKFLTLLSHNYKACPIIKDFYYSDTADKQASELGFTHLGKVKIIAHNWVEQLLYKADADLFNKTINQINKFKSI